MPPKGHAILSASSSERWLNCPPSARLCEAYEDKGSDYAAEGTDAHALCEFRLKQALGIQAESPIETLSWYSEEMEDCAAGYAAYVVELLEAAKQTCSDPVVMIEQRVDFSRWVQDGFGTADCILIADGTLNICDYKHGKGVEVSAEQNPQMMLYALGALEIFDGIYDIDTVRMTIYQPPAFEILLFGVSVNGGAVVVYDLAQGEKIPTEILTALTDTSVIKECNNHSRHQKQVHGNTAVL